MATRTISTKLAIEGESEYRQAITNINNSLRTLKSELALVESQFRNDANSQAALTAKGEVLAKQLDVQEKKLAEAEKALANAQKAQAQFAETVADCGTKIAAAEVQLEKLKSGTGDSAKEQAQLNAQLEEYRKKQTAAQMYLAAAQKGVEDWQRTINYAQRDVNALNGKIEENKKYLDEAKASSDGHAKSIDEYGKKINQTTQELKDVNEAISVLASALAAAGIARGVKEIAQALWDCMEASMGFESAITGVYKTVEGTPAQLQAIADGIKIMTTTIPASKKEIAAVAEAAGQLGIATEDILSFSRTMLDLGESTNMTADAAATDLARVANITGTVGDGYSRMGSTVVALGNSAATTESEIVAMTTRLASAGTLAGLTVPEIMALATSMSSVGIEAEAGGTTMTQTLTAIEQAVVSGGKTLEQYAKIADMSATEFSTAWKDAPATAIQAFISGLGKLDEQGESATLVLDELGLSGVRQSNMLKSLALASDTLASSVSLANQAWAENTALTEEANKRYETTESKMAMMGNAADNVKVAIGDALTPALGDLAEAGTDAFGFAADFVEANPWLVQALTGLTASVGVLTVGVTGYTVAVNLGSKATAAFNLALDKCPAIAVASAITGLVVAAGAYVSSLEQASEENKAFLDSLKESQKTFDETARGLQQDADDTLSMVSALESLAAVEVKSTAQKQAMAEMVDQLNQSVPGLALAYDDLNDSLSMTAEDIRAVAQAQAEQQLREAEIQRLSELYVEQAQISTQLAAAETQLAKAQADANAMREAGTYGAVGYEAATLEVDSAIASAVSSAKKLTKALDENLAVGQALDPEYEILAQNVEDAGSAIEDTGGTAKTVAEQIAELTAGLTDLSDETKDLVSEMDTLSSALKEQKEKGSLSVSTTLELADAGYAAALSINKETGAITLNKAAYIEIARVKLDKQISDIEGQKRAIDNAISLEREAQAALTDAWAYTLLRESQAKVTDMEGQSRAYEVQIAALEKLKASLGSVTTASSKAKTQAEKNLDAYKELTAALDHERAMDLISERDYYQKLKEYRDRYLTDAGNLDEYRRVTEQLYSYDKALVDAEAALWDEATGNFVSELEARAKSALDEFNRMRQSLADYGDLFKIEDDKLALESIQDQIDAINAYEEAVAALDERGISASLMDEVLGMDVDEATQYAQQLIAMTEEQWDQYNTLWEEKQRRALEVAQKFYQDQIDALTEEYDGKLGEALGELTDTAYLSGVDTVQGLIDGLAAKESALYAKARTMANEISRILSEANAASIDVDGSHAGGLAYVPYDGYIAELHQGERVLTAQEAQNYIAQAVPRSFEPPRGDNTQQVLSSMLEQAVNAIPAAAAGTLNMGIKLQMNVDGKEFYTETIDDLRSVMRSAPEVKDD